MTGPLRLLPGDAVEVRSAKEIYATLDSTGCCERLPFMPEMVRFCGRRFRVSQRPERTCIELGGFGRIEHTVMLDNLRCDGSAHDGCDRGCTLLWKESWLRKVDRRSISPPSNSEGQHFTADSSDPFPYPTVIDGRYMCQVTEQTNSTSPLRGMALSQYARDWRARNMGAFRFVHFMSLAAFVRFRQLLTDMPFPGLQGRQKKTPNTVLDLREGEFVKVKSPEAIEATLDTLCKEARGFRRTCEDLEGRQPLTRA